jgi:23S rRNA (cytosine1962-C5)-methyltransferase
MIAPHTRSALFSTAANEVEVERTLEANEKVEEATATMSSTTPLPLYTVMVTRNRQSMSFREGNPLIYSGAISYTLAQCEGEGASDSIPMGALVKVSVMGADDSTSDMSSYLPKKNKNSPGRNQKRGGRGGGGRGGRGRGGGGGDEATAATTDQKKVTAPHFTFTNQCSDVHVPSTPDQKLQDALKKDKSQGQTIGYGVYNPFSMYRVRMLCHELSDPQLFRQVHQTMSKSLTDSSTANDNESDPASPQTMELALQLILQQKLQHAIACRQMMGLPSTSGDNDTDTDTFRLINGEGDGLSGLVVDVLGMQVAVIMSSASWCEVHKELIEQEVTKALEQAYPSNGDGGGTIDLIWRTTPSRLEQDGYEGDKKEATFSQELQDKLVVATEHSVKYQTFPWAGGQKTGFYCDQRDNRRMLGGGGGASTSMANKRVLDLCCYSGGFALHAAKNGASHVVGVDSSQDAIDCATANAQLNGFMTVTDDDDDTTTTKMQFVKADVAQYMKDAYNKITSSDAQQQQELDNTSPSPYFDVIVLDPPKLAPSVTGLDRASRKYQALNRDALKLICPQKGGLLLTHSCSAAMTQKDGGAFFINTVNSAATAARRRITLLQKGGAASCHPVSAAGYPNGAYLTSALFYVSPVTTNN